MTWEEYVDSEIKHKQQMELEEKKIEVLARMQEISASNVNVSGVSGSQAVARGSASSDSSSQGVFFGRKNNRSV